MALQSLTIFPVPRRWRGTGFPLGRASGFFPLVGLLVGAALMAMDWLLQAMAPPNVSSAVVLALWVILTGGLHLDGLADTLDALGGGWSREEALAIMRDSRIGAFGASGLVLALLLKAACIGALWPGLRWRALLLVPAVGRLAPVALACLCPPARPDGQGSEFARSMDRVSLVGAMGVALLMGLVLFGWIGLSLLAWGLLVTWGFAAYLRRRLGGLTGDTLGASVELVEVALLLGLVVGG